MTDLFGSQAPVFKVDGSVKGELARDLSLLEIEEAKVSIKATTTEKLGFTGRGEGIAAQAVASVRLPE